MTAKEIELLQTVSVRYSSKLKQWSSGAILNIDGYLVDTGTKYFETMEEAVNNVKSDIVLAIQKFTNS